MTCSSPLARAERLSRRVIFKFLHDAEARLIATREGGMTKGREEGHDTRQGALSVAAAAWVAGAGIALGKPWGKLRLLRRRAATAIAKLGNRGPQEALEKQLDELGHLLDEGGRSTIDRESRITADEGLDQGDHALRQSEESVDASKPKISDIDEVRATMTTIELSPGCDRWTVGDPTKNPPNDRQFLEAVVSTGFLAFTHQGGLIGGQSEHRAVVVIHRGRGVKWEVVFQESDTDVVTTTTTDLKRMTDTMLSWLRGSSLAADEDSVRAVAVL